VKAGGGEPASIIPIPIPIPINSRDQGSGSTEQTFDVEVREHPTII